jgi:hemerythrin-like domain-containing protein
MSTRQRELIDFTMMYATHRAFRRDLQRLEAAAMAQDHDTTPIRDGWNNFKAQLLIHHSAEDNHLWPKARAATDRSDQLRLLQDMEDEHARLDPLLSALDDDFAAGRAEVGEHVRQLAATFGHHLDHEEREGLPLIQALLTPADWADFAAHIRRRQGVKGAAIYVPWVLDGTPPADQKEFLAALPPPVRLLNRMRWAPRYERLNLWSL